MKTIRSTLSRFAPAGALLFLAASGSLLTGACGSDENDDPDVAADTSGSDVVDTGTTDTSTDAVADATGDLPGPSDATTDTATDAAAETGVVSEPADFGCFGEDPPTTAADPIEFAGSVRELFTGAGIGGADVAALSWADDSVAAQTECDIEGRFSLTVPTGGTPWEGYFRVTQPDVEGFLTTDLYAGMLLTEDSEGVNLRSLEVDDRTLLSNISEVAVAEGTSTMVVALMDCAGDAIVGATVEISPRRDDTAVVFTKVSNDLPDPTLTTTTATGLALVFNVPTDEGDVTVTITHADGTHSLQVRPIADGVIALFTNP